MNYFQPCTKTSSPWTPLLIAPSTTTIPTIESNQQPVTPVRNPHQVDLGQGEPECLTTFEDQPQSTQKSEIIKVLDKLLSATLDNNDKFISKIHEAYHSQ